MSALASRVQRRQHGKFLPGHILRRMFALPAVAAAASSFPCPQRGGEHEAFFPAIALTFPSGRADCRRFSLFKRYQLPESSSRIIYGQRFANTFLRQATTAVRHARYQVSRRNDPLCSAAAPAFPLGCTRRVYPLKHSPASECLSRQIFCCQSSVPSCLAVFIFR